MTYRPLAGVLLATAAAAFAVPALAQDPIPDATPDATFGEGGYAFGPQLRDLNQAVGLYVQPDGKVVATVVRGPGGYVPPRASAQSKAEDAVAVTLMRFTAAGAPDPTFRFDSVPGRENEPGVGEAFGDFGPIAEVAAVLPLAVGPGPGGTTQVLVTYPFLTDDPDSEVIGPAVVLARYTDGGELDERFDADGLRHIQLPGACPSAQAATFRPDGTITVVGGGRGFNSQDCANPEGPQQSVYTLSADGVVNAETMRNLDLTGGRDGYVTGVAAGPDGRTYGVAERYAQSDERTIAESDTGVVFALDGANNPLESFDVTGGKGLEGVPVAVAVTPAGEPELVQGPVPSDMRLAAGLHLSRLTTAGAPAPAFGGGQPVALGLPFTTRRRAGLQIDALGRTYVVAQGSDGVVRIARVTDDGVLDPEFGTGGVAAYQAPAEGQFGDARDDATLGPATALDADGRLVFASGYVPRETARAVPFLRSAAVVRIAGKAVVVPAPTPTPPPPAATPDPGPAPTPGPGPGTGHAPTPGPVPVEGTGPPPTVLPNTKKCVSRRVFTIRLRPKRVKIVSAIVRVNGKRVAVRKGKRITAPVDLRGLPFGRFTVSIDARKADGTRYTEVRRYKTCGQKPGKNPGKVKVTKPKR